MEYQRSSIQGVYISQTEQGNAPTVLLQVADSHYIPIYIGLWEAISINNALNQETLPRPITHDLFPELFARFALSVVSLHIDSLDDGVFFANLIIKQGDREEMLDCRPSDGIAIALRVDAPILVASDVVTKAAIERQELEKMVDIKSFL